jgi:hypothetical protein
VVFGSTTPGVCTVSGATVTVVSGGVCALTANQAGNAGYAAAPTLTANVTITPAAQTITFAPLTNRVIGTAPFAITATSSSGLPVAFASNTPATCGVSAGTVTLLAIGTCTVRASQAGNASYAAATDVLQSFTITSAAATQLAITSNPTPIVERQGYQISFAVTGSTPTGTVSWTSPAAPSPAPGCTPLTLVNGRATIPTNCLPSALAGGDTLTINANYGGDANNAAASATASFTVTGFVRNMSLGVDITNPRASAPILLTALVRGLVPNGTVTFAINGAALTSCTNVSVSSLPLDANAAVATCRTSAVAGAVQYTATYGNDSVNTLPVAQLSANSPVNGPADYNGMWWAGQQENGWGFHIAQNGQQQFNTFYVHDSAGKSVWYAISGGSWNADFTRFTGDIYQPTGSAFTAYDVNQWKPGAPVGRGSLTFTSLNEAVFDYTISGVTGRKNITRFNFAGGDSSPRIIVKDMWWAGERENGWGIAIAQQSSELFAAWYTYGADGKTIWFVMLGGTWTGTTYQGQLYTSTSSPWLGAPYNAQLFNPQFVGSIALDFRDQNNANMTYFVNGVQQTKAITRLPF